MFDDLQGLLKSKGIKDFDDLRPDERETYFEMLKMVESAKITLEDFKKYVRAMRQMVEQELASHRPGFIRRLWDGDKDTMLKARLKNYILFEAFFERPDRAKDMLERYGGKKAGGQ